MIKTYEIFPGVTLRCFSDTRFKQGCLSFQIIRPQCREEAAMNALIPTVLLRGCESCPDLRAITNKLDALYGASVGTMVRRVGDYQATGLYCAFLEDRFAMTGDRILQPMMEFLGELLLQPVMEDGGFDRSFVAGEKKNLIATIESELNDKRAYAMGRLLRNMCCADSFGVPRLGDPEAVAEIDAKTLYDHYRQILRSSAIELFYVGSTEGRAVAALVEKMLSQIERAYVPLAPQCAFCDAGGSEVSEEMDAAQSVLCMGFVTDITSESPSFAAMQVLNTVFGAGMTSKLFMQVRERLSLCYAIGSGYYGSKGIMTVSAGIDREKEAQVRQEVLSQLAACCRGEITQEELNAAKEALLSSLRGIHDSPGSIESYYSTHRLSGMFRSPQQYMEEILAVTMEDVIAAAKTVKLHTTYFLKGVQA
ncbi:MAG: insulinase family protein [Oscillospiraceae bacterium]|nr:insulinase family protein [Oscillospiraceae bacterium]